MKANAIGYIPMYASMNLAIRSFGIFNSVGIIMESIAHMITSP